MGWGPEVGVRSAVSWGAGQYSQPTTVILIALGLHKSELLLHHWMSVKQSQVHIR